MKKDVLAYFWEKIKTLIEGLVSKETLNETLTDYVKTENLPDASKAVSAHNTSEEAHSDIRQLLETLSEKVGDIDGGTP